MNLGNLHVTTTSGETFTGEEHAQMAHLIYKRFGYDVTLAANKWRQMLQNNVSDADFLKLALLVDEDTPTHTLETRETTTDHQNTGGDPKWLEEFCKRLNHMTDALMKLLVAALMDRSKTQADAYAYTFMAFDHLVRQCEQNPEFVGARVGETFEFEGETCTVIRVGEPDSYRSVTTRSHTDGAELTIGLDAFLSTVYRVKGEET